MNAIKRILLESDAVAVMPSASVHSGMDADKIVALSRFHMPWLVGRIGFITAKARKLSALGQEFRKAVLKIEAERRAASLG
jgi:hypothetical protein